NLDKVVGEADGSQNYIQHPFLWQNGVMSDLGTLGGSGDNYSRANAINDAGQVVGFSQPGRFTIVHAFLYQAGRMVDLGTLPGYGGGAARAINANGLIVGQSDINGGGSRAFLWTPTSPNAQTGSMQDLGTLSGDSRAYGI